MTNFQIRPAAMLPRIVFQGGGEGPVLQITADGELIFKDASAAAAALMAEWKRLMGQPVTPAPIDAPKEKWPLAGTLRRVRDLIAFCDRNAKSELKLDLRDVRNLADAALKCAHHQKGAALEERGDIKRWQADQHEYFDNTIVEIVTEYAEWRDRQDGAAAAGQWSAEAKRTWEEQTGQPADQMPDPERSPK